MTEGHALVVQAMQQLGYHALWLERGLISPDMILRQFQDFEAGYSYAQSTEHLRYSALQAWALFHPFPTDDELAAVLEALRVDEDRVMARSFLIHTLAGREQTVEQMRMVQAAMVELGCDASDVLWVEYHWRRGVDTLDDDLIRRAIEHGDASVHKALIADAKTAWILRALVEQGRNKEVRHTARQRLQHLEREQAGDA
jgi:hypothetical protein